MKNIKDLTNEQLVKKIIVNSVKAAKMGMVEVQENDFLAFDAHHPFIEIAKELNEAKDEILKRLNKK